MILVVSRKGRGIGGMQTLTRDLHDVTKQIDPSTRHATLKTVLHIPFWAVQILYYCFCNRKSLTVLLCDASLASLGTLLKKIFPRVRIVAIACGLDVIYTRKLYQRILRGSFSSVDHFIAISHATKEELLSRGVSDERITVIPCGVWGRAYDPVSRRSQNDVRLITVGRLIPRKGHTWFLSEVVPRLLQTYPSLRYDIVGIGPEIPTLRKIIEERNLDESVTLHGMLTEQNKQYIVRQAHLCIMPNISVEGDMEGFGIACIESTSQGIPVVASRVEGLQDAVREGETGAFFTPSDPDDCLTKIEHLLKDPLDPQSVAAATMKYYDWSSLIPSYEEILRP